ncbi:hypothetical protein FACS1894172_03270 [Spirochaetia bacterium]|nr:hypothetical protein FACS1894164_19670 [Spirochaetia bacterium]GHU30293.1 hypothetical protein FACS1894172_03270 [Spirochaetia bacterium]
MGQKEKHCIDIHEKAEEAGITNPVVIDSGLLKMMTPNPYLASIGVSLEERIKNLLGLVKANLHTGKDSEKVEKKYYIPFMVLKGPLVKEDFLSVIMNIETKGEDRTVITLLPADNGDSGECAV